MTSFPKQIQRWKQITKKTAFQFLAEGQNCLLSAGHIFNKTLEDAFDIFPRKLTANQCTSYLEQTEASKGDKAWRECRSASSTKLIFSNGSSVYSADAKICYCMTIEDKVFLCLVNYSQDPKWHADNKYDWGFTIYCVK